MTNSPIIRILYQKDRDKKSSKRSIFQDFEYGGVN